MVLAALMGVICTWIFGLGWLACAASGAHILLRGRFTRRGRLFAWLDPERKAVIVSGREAIEEGIIRLVGGLFLAAAPLVLAFRATPEIWRLFRTGP